MALGTRKKDQTIKLPDKCGILLFNLYEERESWLNAVQADQFSLFIWEWEQSVLRSLRKHGHINGIEIDKISAIELFDLIDQEWFRMKSSYIKIDTES